MTIARTSCCQLSVVALSVLLCISTFSPAQSTSRPTTAASNPTTSPSGTNADAVRRLREAVDQYYSYRDLRNVPWDTLFNHYTPLLERAETPRQFAEHAAKMLAVARDIHVSVKIDDETIGGFRRDVKRNYDLAALAQQVPAWKDLSSQVSTGRLPKGIGYVLIKSWRKDEQQVLKPALAALRDLTDTHSLIIDVRPNGGGSEPFAQKVAGCFVDQPVVYAKHITRDPSAEGGWTPIRDRTLTPNPDQPGYRGKVAVLMGEVNMSSCESFLLMMKQVPNCKLIGEKSYGSSGNPKPHDLGNGVVVSLPSWKDLTPDGTPLEGKGIEPDIVVRATPQELQTRDPVLQAAIDWINGTCKVP